LNQLHRRRGGIVYQGKSRETMERDTEYEKTKLKYLLWNSSNPRNT